MKPLKNIPALACLMWICLFSFSISAIAAPYFISADDLKAELNSKRLVILDARANKSDYELGHLPEAVHVSWETFANTKGKPGLNWGILLPKDTLENEFGELGICNDSKVIVYIDPLTGWGEDGRFLWMLRMAGIENSSILDGGYSVWKSKGYPVTKEPPKIAPSTLSISKLKDDLNADTAFVISHQDNAKIIDTREKKEYDGAMLYGEARGGHIPKAIHFHFKDLLKPDGTLKSKDAIDSTLKKIGIKKSDVIVAYCTAGIRSAYFTMVLRMLGYSKARNYDASFYHWAADSRLAVE